MARHIEDGGPRAARAGAGDSLAAATEKARILDRDYFQHNPRARSYTRPYIEGECVGIAGGGFRPAFVAVAFVSPSMRVKVAVMDRAGLAEGKREAEAFAARWRGTPHRGVSA